MQGSFAYRHSGLTVASAIALPEWEAFAIEDASCPDVAITIADNPPPIFAEGSEVTVPDGRLRFAIPGIGGWEIVGGHAISIFPSLAADPAELRLFTLGSAWAALGYQRGFAMWHGSCVAYEGRAVLMCGAAGAGKSTLAAALVDRGASLVADDLSRAAPSAEGAVIYPSSTRIKLWREAMERLGWGDRQIGRDWMREDKLHCAAGSLARDAAPLRLHAIIVLDEGDAEATRRLKGSEALSAVMEGTLYRPQMLDALDGWGAQGALAASIVAATPVYRLTRPKDFAALDQTCAVIERLTAT